MEHQDFKTCQKLQHFANVLKYGIKDCKERCTKFGNCYVKTNLKLRKDEMERMKKQQKVT